MHTAKRVLPRIIANSFFGIEASLMRLLMCLLAHSMAVTDYDCIQDCSDAG